MGIVNKGMVHKVLSKPQVQAHTTGKGKARYKSVNNKRITTQGQVAIQRGHVGAMSCVRAIQGKARHTGR